MKRRNFLKSIAGLPFVGLLTKARADKPPEQKRPEREYCNLDLMMMKKGPYGWPPICFTQFDEDLWFLLENREVWQLGDSGRWHFVMKMPYFVNCIWVWFASYGRIGQEPDYLIHGTGKYRGSIACFEKLIPKQELELRKLCLDEVS